MLERYWLEAVPRKPLLGACAYFAVLGAPGPGIEHWLATRGLDVARTNWSPGALPQNRRYRTDYQSLHPLFSAGRFGDENLSAAHFFAAQRCADGERPACRDLVLDSALRTLAPPYAQQFLARRPNPNDSTPLYVMHGYAGGYVQVSNGFLAAVMETEGRDRFNRFWQSEESPEIAFQAAIGQPIDDWTREWVQKTIGYTTRGSRVPITSGLIVVVLAAMGFAVAVVVANTRTLR
jgi:hypothetical protein